LFAFIGSTNLYRKDARLLSLRVVGRMTPPADPRMSLADWQRFWGGGNTGSLEGVIHYRGRDLAARLGNQLESLRPEDFRLASVSAGKGAGDEGNDLVPAWISWAPALLTNAGRRRPIISSG
jgi:hypothetical protein